MNLIHGDCLVEMRSIPDKSIDMILCDLPYGTTACKWDVVIPFDLLWEQYKRVINNRGAIVLFGSQPFTSALIMSNVKEFSHSWVWNKRFAANYPLAKKQPMKIHEDVVVFGHGYKPIMVKRDKPIKKGTNKGAQIFNKGLENPLYKGKTYVEKYPESIINFEKRKEHSYSPTQKPVALLEYLIKTYTLEGETVLDNCMGSGSTGVACINTKRNFIGIEKDDKYFEIARARILGING